MANQRITKRTVDALSAKPNEFTIWDSAVSGFGVRVRPSGSKVYVVVYRAGAGRGAPAKRYTIASVGKITPEAARARAKAILGSVAHGEDPAGQKATERGVLTVAELADRFMTEHVLAKCKPGTANFYKCILDRWIKPEIGTTKADKLTRFQVGQLHSKMAGSPFQANRVLAAIGSMYSFAAGAGVVTEGTNPARRISKYNESRRERFLTVEELQRLGTAIRDAETIGIPWIVNESQANAKHLPEPEKRFTKINPFSAAALRLLMFTGCRLREILNLRWEHVDMERGLLFLPDSKTGRKTVILNAPALAILKALEEVGPYVIPGDDPECPRPDLKRPWDAITKRADLVGVRLHDLRHTYASFGAGGGLGLPIIGRLLGHTQASTTARYAHLDNDPLRRASEAIAGRIAAALDGKKTATIVKFSRQRR